MGISDTTEVMRGIKAFKRRYISFDDESIALPTRAYRAALTPLKAIVRDKARGRLAGKFWMQRTKHTVLNQQILHPASKQRRNTCKQFCTNQKVFMMMDGFRKRKFRKIQAPLYYNSSNTTMKL
jgi:hypothetical protein